MKLGSLYRGRRGGSCGESGQSQLDLTLRHVPFSDTPNTLEFIDATIQDDSPMSLPMILSYDSDNDGKNNTAP